MRHFTFIILFGFSVLAQASPQKHAPEVTFDQVEEIFGHNLNPSNSTLKMLLLAIGMDHTSTDSPHQSQRIGIPYIVHDSPSLWVSRLQSGEKGVDVLVNNALLLLFSREPIPGAQDAATHLMQLAADRGYWPADFYIAEINLSGYLTESDAQIGILPADIQTARDTMSRYNKCAEMGFAPCQYRIGFWLSNSLPSMADGVSVLRSAINTTINDTRYQGVLDGAIVMAATEIVYKGAEAGLGDDVRREYVELIEHQLKQIAAEGPIE
jgi:hypothetical protein